jgi:hypothetical protein
LFENHSENSLKPDLSNDTSVNPPLFSLVNTFNIKKRIKQEKIWTYTGAYTVIFRGGFSIKSQWYSGKINAPGSPSSGLKRCICFWKLRRSVA